MNEDACSQNEAKQALPIARRATVSPYEWDARERVSRATRIALGILGAGLILVFAIAAYLNPYNADGSARVMATHMQLGLPPCNMVLLTGKPCPTCGMTTSFALLVHGDIRNSLQANWAGTLIAIFWLALIPWSIFAAVKGRVLGIKNLELFVTIAVGVGLSITLIRWAFVLLGR